MTDAQWAERITALAKDRVSKRLYTFESQIKSAVNQLCHTRGIQRELVHKTLTWLLKEDKHYLPAGTDVNDEGWLARMQSGEEDAIRAEMMAKLDIFGQLRKADGKDWTPAAGEPEAPAKAGLDDISF